MRPLLLAPIVLLIIILTVSADDGSITDNDQGSGLLSYSGGYPGLGQTGTFVPSSHMGIDQQSTGSLEMYQDYYDFGQGTQYSTGPAQFNIHGAEPTYLIINGQSRPYSSYYVPTNSLWIQGRTSWTQYIECPLNARIMMLAYSNGGSASMIEKYESGLQDVNYYNFYQGYTQLVFVANEVGRHILTFYSNGQQSNSIIFDVVSYGGSYVPGHTLPIGQPSSSTVKINIGVVGTGSGQTSGSNQATGQGCNILGTWSFGENGPYNIINADGTTLAKDNLNGESFDSGTWRVIDASRRLYGFTWQSGWSHTFTLSADCSSLDGYGRLNGGAEKPSHGVRVSGSGGNGYSNTNSGYPQTFIDSADQGFDPNAHIGDYEGTSTQSGEIMVDSTANGFDPTALPQGEAI